MESRLGLQTITIIRELGRQQLEIGAAFDGRCTKHDQIVQCIVAEIDSLRLMMNMQMFQRTAILTSRLIALEQKCESRASGAAAFSRVRSSFQFSDQVNQFRELEKSSWSRRTPRQGVRK
jgi:hypothetical protein